MNIILIPLLIFLVVCFIAMQAEKYVWNKGKCFCGTPWEYFDTDSQGGRGYKCIQCQRKVWISWPVDGKYWRDFL